MEQLGKDRQFTGLGVSPGIAIGIAHVRETGVIDVPEYVIEADTIEAEKARLSKAVKVAQRQIRRFQGKAAALSGAAAEELVFLFDAYQQMLGDSRLVRGAEQRIEIGRLNAEAAVHNEVSEIAETFLAMDDAYIASRLDDIREVANRIIRNLTRTPIKPFSALPAGSIVITEQLTPAGMAQLDPSVVIAAAATLGGAEGHTAIMARALGIPAVLGVPDLMAETHNGDTVIIDGGSGRVIVDPSDKTLDKYKRRQSDMIDARRRLARLRDQPSVSRDGTDFGLFANVELPMEMAMVQQAGARGIGLLRSEFLFMNRARLPSEDEQYECLRDLVEAMAGRTVTIRSLDVGADKEVGAVTGDLDDSAASALGLRGIRLSLLHRDELETQFRAILRAAAHGPVRILLPMVSAVSEVHQARDVLMRAAKKLRRRKVKIPAELPPLGVMIEVPGAALAADSLARISDFFAIGSNDLTMYTLAIDRANEHVAHLFDPLHPGVLRLIQFSTAAAQRAGIPVSICGEIAGDPRYTALLTGLGLRELSMTPSSILKVKQRIIGMDARAATQRAQLIMDQTDAGRIATLLDDFNALA